MNYKAKAIELIDDKKERKLIKTKIVNILATMVFSFRDLTAKQQEERVIKTMEILVELMHSKAVEVVEGLLETNEALEEEIRRLKHD